MYFHSQTKLKKLKENLNIFPSQQTICICVHIFLLHSSSYEWLCLLLKKFFYLFTIAYLIPSIWHRYILASFSFTSVTSVFCYMGSFPSEYKHAVNSYLKKPSLDPNIFPPHTSPKYLHRAFPHTDLPPSSHYLLNPLSLGFYAQ